MSSGTLNPTKPYLYHTDDLLALGCNTCLVWVYACIICDCCECCQPKLMGMCCLPLKSILQADNLLLDRTLEVKDRSRAAGRNTSLMQDNDWPLVGYLKVRIEQYEIMSALSCSLLHGKLEQLVLLNLVQCCTLIISEHTAVTACFGFWGHIARLCFRIEVSEILHHASCICVYSGWNLEYLPYITGN